VDWNRLYACWPNLKAPIDYTNALFEVDGEEGLETVEEFYTGETSPQNLKNEADLVQVQDIQQGLQQSVQVLN